MKSIFSILTLFLTLGVVNQQCTSTKNTEEEQKYMNQIIFQRDQKNIQFGSDKKSPFGDSSQKFVGLDYYQVDPSWRKKAEFVPGKSIKPVDIKDSKGNTRKYFNPGTLQFFHNNNKYQIPVLVEENYPNMFFLMFRDLTNNKETYGGGRYIEMEVTPNQKEYYIDFNQAFNPYCHYNHKYSCPIVPESAKFEFEIKAGEKMYSTK